MPKQVKAKKDDEINPQNKNFHGFKHKILMLLMLS